MRHPRHGEGLIAEGILKINKRHGNALATAAEDLKNELCRIRERLEQGGAR
jgi:hypothetical protein